MQLLLYKLILKLIFILLCSKKYAAEPRENIFSNFYYMKNQILALREELIITGVEEDASFTGGYGIKYWLALPSNYHHFLIGMRKRGINLITIDNKGGNLYQAVEKPIDIGENVTSAVAFSCLNIINQRTENLVLISTNSPKFEIMWFSIHNYKLVHIWSWIRYSGVHSILYANIMGEHHLLILDANGTTLHIYSFHFESSLPNIREIQVISFDEKVIAVSLSNTFSEPFLYVQKKDELGIYRYSRLCTESSVGFFSKKTSLRNMNINHIYPFYVDGREYLAIAGKDAAILKFDSSGNLTPEMNLDNIMDWIIMRTGPEKERVILFGKSMSGNIEVFSNGGLGWSQNPAPSCYKVNKETNEEIEKQRELGCLKGKSWAGVASLDIGDLPTLIFADRKFFGEMFHVIVKMKRDILPLDILPPMPEIENNYLWRMKSNMEELVSDIQRSKSSDKCNIFDTFSAIEKVALKVKEELIEKCKVSYKNATARNRFESSYKQNIANRGADLINKGSELDKPAHINKHFNEYIQDSLFEKDDNKIEATTDYPFDSPPISPDIEEKSPHLSMVPNDLNFGATGLRKSELIV